MGVSHVYSLLSYYMHTVYSQANEDAMKYEHVLNESISLKMKLKEEEMLKRKAEEEQRRIAGKLVKVQRGKIGCCKDSEDNLCV